MLVTGGGSGIGAACAGLFARSGASVVVVDRNRSAAEETAAALDGSPGGALAVDADVSDPDAAERMVAAAVDRFGRLDTAVNNAAVAHRRAPLGELTADEWRAALSVNLDGAFYCLRAELAALQAGGQGGAIVNMASILGAVAGPGVGAYVAAKHGLVGLTKAAALEYASEGIRVNAVGPGFVETPLLLANMTAAELEVRAQAHALGRLGTMDEVAELVVWLCGDGASFVTGAYYPVDGGYLAR